MTVRKSQPADLPRILEIYAFAREQMKKNGNPNQWGNTHPPVEIIEQDIEKGTGFAVCEGEEIKGVFAFLLGEDPTYRVIEEGKWPNEKPYGTIHRIAAAEGAHGILAAAVSFGATQVKELRADTHKDNYVMQNALQKQGFSYCGIIHLANGAPRLAYHKSVK